MFDPTLIRKDFPILNRTIHGKPLIYFDNAATTQKPRQVLDAARFYYENLNANIHRGVHTLSQEATTAHEEARACVAQFLGTDDPGEIIFTSGCTEGLNLVAHILTTSGHLRPDDEIIISALEHHSNIVPWQLACERTGAKLRILPLTPEGAWNRAAYTRLLSSRTRIVSLSHVSNALGTIHPIAELMAEAKAHNPDIITVIDGAQAVPHLPVRVRELNADFYAFSGHKIYAPTGIGALWGRRSLLESLPPYKGGGEMIRQVTFEHTTYNDLPFKYEAGTPNIEGAISLKAALDYVDQWGLSALEAYESTLTTHCLEGLRTFDGVHILADGLPRAGVISFLVDGVHHYDLGVLLDQYGIAVRTGHHCCQPLMGLFNTTGTTRASFALYNTLEEVDTFLTYLDRCLSMLR